MYARLPRKSSHTVILMLKVVVVAEEAKAANAVRTIAKTMIAKATEKAEPAAAVANLLLHSIRV